MINYLPTVLILAVILSVMIVVPYQLNKAYEKLSAKCEGCYYD